MLGPEPNDDSFHTQGDSDLRGFRLPQRAGFNLDELLAGILEKRFGEHAVCFMEEQKEPSRADIPRLASGFELAT